MLQQRSRYLLRELQNSNLGPNPRFMSRIRILRKSPTLSRVCQFAQKPALLKNHRIWPPKRVLQFPLLVLISFFWMSFATTGENSRAFYAISSLRCHLDQLTCDAIDEDPIAFEEEDIEHLWSKAADCPYFGEINFAQACYYRSGGRDPDLLLRSNEILGEVWDNLNRAYFENIRSFADTEFLLISNDSKYLLPPDNPLKPNLDKIFSNPHVLDNNETFSNAGFITLYNQRTGMRVARHPLLPGHLIKTFLSSEQIIGTDKWNWMTLRCKGAKNVRNLIAAENLRFFSVPDKWIYPLPNVTHRSTYTQTAVLVVTDMKLVSEKDSRDAWKKATTKQIDELYSILNHGYASCYLPFNIAYTEDHKFACIDTAFPKRFLNLQRARQYLSKEMQSYWDKLIKKGGKAK